MNIDVEFSFSAFVYTYHARSSVLQMRIATRKAHNITHHNELTYRRVYKIFLVTTCYHFLPPFSLLSRMEWDLHASARVFKSLVVDFSCVFCVLIPYDLGRSDHILMGYRICIHSAIFSLFSSLLFSTTLTMCSFVACMRISQKLILLYIWIIYWTTYALDLLVDR